MEGRNYIDPKVRLIEKSMDNLGYFMWLKSRRKIITDLNGNDFMKDMQPSEDWMDNMPSEFIVGDEKVELYDYLNRINKMNLQYNNFGDYVFEIDGSCLFRDFLFNINRVAQWAESNRFIFSILGSEAVYDPMNYRISAEYKDIPEWEEQFDKYMEAIKADPIVDHNRIEMPYSISSTFWISINRKLLLEVLSVMKNKFPVFYEVYGKQFIASTDIEDSELVPWTPASLSQYFIKHPENFTEGSHHIDDTYIINTKMGLILYSQFLRQADTRISGYFNILEHKDPEEFIHKVFKGGTVFDVNYVAHEDKVMSTVRTRLCAFAMSSGDDPCSWSYFLNNFLPDSITPEEFMSMLPCKFVNKELVDCRYREDIKFRNEGKELSNCPCPLVTLSMKDAESKRSRDNNKIGDAFYELTKYLINE